MDDDDDDDVTKYKKRVGCERDVTFHHGYSSFSATSKTSNVL